MSMLRLNNEYTQLHVNQATLKSAVDLAYRVTMSPHEWTWTNEEATEMAQYVLWACQKLEAIDHIIHRELSH